MCRTGRPPEEEGASREPDFSLKNSNNNKEMEIQPIILFFPLTSLSLCVCKDIKTLLFGWVTPYLY